MVFKTQILKLDVFIASRPSQKIKLGNIYVSVHPMHTHTSTIPFWILLLFIVVKVLVVASTIPSSFMWPYNSFVIQVKFICYCLFHFELLQILAYYNDFMYLFWICINIVLRVRVILNCSEIEKLYYLCQCYYAICIFCPVPIHSVEQTIPLIFV